MEVYREGQRILERQRFQFPTSWLHVENLEGEWGAFNEIIKRKDSSIQTQVASLQQKIVSEDKAVESRTNDFLNDWERSRPVEGHLRPDDALTQLQLFESKFARLKEERDNVSKAKEALELQDPGNMSSNTFLINLCKTVYSKFYPKIKCVGATIKTNFALILT